MSIRLSGEQLAPINSNERLVVIDAVAGAGKTSVLRHKSKKEGSSRILYTGFISSTSGMSGFSGNVDTKSIYSLAYNSVGFKFRDRLVKSISPSKVLDFFYLGKSVDNYRFAAEIVSVLSRYYQSDASSFSDYLVKQCDVADDLVKESASLLAEEMENEAKTFPVVHDTYLKIYSRICDFSTYDIVMVDEVQDSNSAISAIIKKMINDCSQIVLVGDRLQAIYSFRGAVDLFSEFRKGAQFSLTKSFRFGKNISDVVNRIVDLHPLKKCVIDGAGLVDGELDSIGDHEKFACISRANAGVARRFIKYAGAGKKVYIPSLDSKMVLSDAMDLYNLSRGKKKLIKNQFISDFSSFREFFEFAQRTEKPSLQMSCELVRKGKSNTARLIRDVSEGFSTLMGADVVCMTAHQSKGLEFKNVVLGNDYPKIKPGKGWDVKSIEELNILYVALTRAKCKMNLNDTVKQILLENEKRQLHSKIYIEEQKGEKELQCID